MSGTSDLISRCELFNRLANVKDLGEAFAVIQGMPTAQPEQKKGTWIEFDSDNDKYDEIKCNRCEKIFTVDAYHWTDIGFTKDDLKFCPHCGADMRGDEQDG